MTPSPASDTARSSSPELSLGDRNKRFRPRLELSRPRSNRNGAPHVTIDDPLAPPESGAEKMRRLRQTPGTRTQYHLRAKTIAQSRALTWIRTEHRDVWEGLLDEAWAELGHPRYSNKRRYRRGPRI